MPDFDDNRGISLILVNTKKGLAIYRMDLQSKCNSS